MVTTPAPDLSTPKEVITITEEEILGTPSETEKSVEKEKVSLEKEASPSKSTTIQKTEEEITKEPDTKRSAPNTETTEQNEIPQASDTPLNTQHPIPNTDLFDNLVKKIYDRDYDLGSCFERNITFVSFEENLLTWESTAEDADKKMLIKHWGVINMFVKEIFGIETTIKNIAKKKAPTSNPVDATVSHTQTENNNPNTPVHNDADTGSMIEEVEMKSSCIAPDAGETEAAKEKDPSVLLQEPMIKTAMELFAPKKVRIKKNV